METIKSEELDSAKFETRGQQVNTPPSEITNGRTGRVLIPNANTYWSGHGWVRENTKLEKSQNSARLIHSVFFAHKLLNDMREGGPADTPT